MPSEHKLTDDRAQSGCFLFVFICQHLCQTEKSKHSCGFLDFFRGLQNCVSRVRALVPLLYLGFEAQYRTRYCTSNFFDYRSDSFSLFCARIFPFFSDFLCQFICQKICQPQHPKKRLRKPYKNESAGSQNAVGRFVLIWLRTAFFVFTP